MKKVGLLTLLVTSLLVAGASHAQEAGPLGDDFQVNTYTTDLQRFPSVATDAEGNFVVVWWSRGSYGSDNSDYSIQGQRFDATGSPLGEQFQVNSYWPHRQWHPAVASDREGNFVVVWESEGSYETDTMRESIQAQRYDSAGTPVGGQFQVNTYWTQGQEYPAVAADPEGNFVVVWSSLGSYGDDTEGYSIQAQRYDPEGNPLGAEFQINSYTTSSQFSPSVASDNQGNFIVTWGGWGSYGTDTHRTSIQAQRFNSNGLPEGGQFQVNSFTWGYQERPVVAAGPQGNFVVVWHTNHSYDPDTDGSSIRAKAYDTEGNSLGGFWDEFQVNSYSTGGQSAPTAVSDVQGNFIVTWLSAGSYGTDTSGFSIQAQRIAADRTRLGNEFQVNNYTTFDQRGPSLAAGPGGNFVVAWHSRGSAGTDTDDWSIQARRFDYGIFYDGFESGDLSAWPKTVP